MAGSVGNNLTEDAPQAEEHGILPPNLRRAYIYLLEVTPKVLRPVRIGKPFREASPDLRRRTTMTAVETGGA